MRRLVAELDAENYDTRMRTTHDLRGLKASTVSELERALAVSELERALENKPAPGTRRRIEDLLSDLKQSLPYHLSSEELRVYRTVQVLEYIGTDAARQFLEKLATGAPEALQTREAKTALQRLVTRADMKNSNK